MKWKPAIIKIMPVGGYLLTALGFLQGEDLTTITGSDIEPEMIALAKKNLALLTLPGLQIRIKQLEQLIESYGKDSHRQALKSALNLQDNVNMRTTPLTLHCFEADMLTTTGLSLLEIQSIDIAITDVPYGDIVTWSESNKNPIDTMLNNLQPYLKRTSVLAIVKNGGKKITHPNYTNLEHFKIGKRQITILAPIVG